MVRIIGEGAEAAENAELGKEQLFNGPTGRTFRATWIERPVNEGSKRGITKAKRKSRRKK